MREGGVWARTIQLKLRYTDFTTITRAHSLARPTQVDVEIFEEVRRLFRKNWKAGAAIRLLGVQTSGFDDDSGQIKLADSLQRDERWGKKQALAAADKVRDRFGESSVGLATGLKGGFRERTHENPAGLPGKKK